MAIKRMIFLLQFINFILCQVNTENLRLEETSKVFINQFNISFDYEGSDSEVFDTFFEYRLDYNPKKENRFFFIANYEQTYEKSSNESINFINKKGFAHLRNTRKFYKNLDIEFFTQYEFNEFLDITKRTLLGSGIRFPIKNKKMNSHIGIGIMKEIENYNNQIFDTEIYRSTNYFNNRMNFNKVVLTNVIYYQFNVDESKDYRILFDNNFEFVLTKNIFLTFELKHRYDNQPNFGQKKNYSQISSGVGFIF